MQVRDELIDAVCRRETGVYTQIFGITGETARLERTVNRYKWLLKRLDARREVWAVFPPAWHVTQLLCVMFCNITKTALAEILDLKVRKCRRWGGWGGEGGAVSPRGQGSGSGEF